MAFDEKVKDFVWVVLHLESVKHALMDSNLRSTLFACPSMSADSRVSSGTSAI